MSGSGHLLDTAGWRGTVRSPGAMSLALLQAAAIRAHGRVGMVLCGRYRIVRLIGVGGMGAVYAGKHRNGHPVAIKVLHERLADSPDLERRFRREAHIANSIDHPAVVPVIDDDVSEDGYVFLVMPLLEGETLRARWERSGRRLPLAEVVVVAHRTLEALAAAHSAKIVHRDVKPENIFVTYSGEVRVFDFGIARFFETNDPSATRSGHAVGTPAFMAPEQALGRHREVDGRTDLWAVGATIFSLLSGRPVHEGATASEVVARAATRPAPLLAEVSPETPTTIQAIVDRALSFAREQRWDGASDMAAALLVASEAVLGRPLSDLPALVTPRPEARDDAAAVGTATPSVPPARRGVPREPLLQTERLRAATTRTIDANRLPRLRGARLWLACVAGIAVFIAVTLFVSMMRSGKRGVVLPPTTTEADATTHYRLGLEAWHDGRHVDDDFVRALELDPTFAPAHLALALVHTWPNAEQRSHFALARQGRASLSERDQALLDACEPSMRVPPDVHETKQRLEPLVTRYNDDFRFADVFGAVLMRLNDGEGMLRLASAMLPSEPTSASAWSTQALGYDLLGNVEKSRESFEQCMKHAPMPTSCIQLLATLESTEGRCERVEELAQMLMASGDRSPRTFGLLAGGAFGRTRDLATLQSVLERAWRTAQPPVPAATQAKQRAMRAVLAGDFDASLAYVREFESLVAKSENELVRMPAAQYTIALAEELGRPAEALARAQRFASEKPALDAHSELDIGVDMDRHIYEAGGIDEAEFARRRDAWVRRQSPKFDRRYGAFTFVWLQAYALPARTRAAAIEAIGRMSGYLPMTDPLNRSAYEGEAIGRVYLLAERPAEALPFLERATRSCSAATEPFSHMWALYDLGLAYAAVHRENDACDALEQIVDVWGKDPRSLTASKAARAMATLQCKQKGK